jgi:hypothetical protein
MRSLRRAAIAGVLALGACIGAATGAELLLDDPATLVVSPPAAWLGPITETGRTGWDCAPEHAATARTAAAAGLPHD